MVISKLLVVHHQSFQRRSTSGTMSEQTQEADPKPFECSICQARFVSKKTRKRHIVVVHEVRLQSNEKIFLLYPSLYSSHHNRSSLHRIPGPFGVHYAIRASSAE